VPGFDSVVKAVHSWAEASKNLIPDLPPFPFADQVPTTAALVENAFEFAARLLTAQREFASAILEAAQPVLAKAKEAQAEKPGKPTAAAKAAS
jgi:hypothetical protein